MFAPVSMKAMCLLPLIRIGNVYGGLVSVETFNLVTVQVTSDDETLAEESDLDKFDCGFDALVILIDGFGAVQAFA